MVVIHVGTPDYAETEFLDTFWGIYYSSVFPDETLSCVKCDCEKINDTVLYDMFWYFDSLNIDFNELDKDVNKPNLTKGVNND